MIDVFLTQVMPKTRDLDELKAMLCLFYLLDQRRTHSSFVTYKELLSCITSMIEMGEETLRRVLNLAVGHGILRRIEDETGEAYELVSSLTSRGNIFSLYEQNIGMLTPMIIEELKEAERLYPEEWIKRAFKEAVMLNKRSWRYISRILEHWASEGKEGGKYRASFKEGGPDKYIKGKYGHLVQR
ncbi:MAG: hypothetical protein COZ67_00540 [Chloroflexi bacterium CG_4_8_14_3_um_filter_45_15]|nr:MAG: hypothetical protein COZ67_00540 [Chloroflexi bacterium CG_4_8_14_3_um_filter_45_15]